MPIKYLPAISGVPEWGDISGSIVSQSDLSEILSNKSPADHNHNLSGLAEKSYNSLDDLPNLNSFIKLSDVTSPPSAYITDGIDDHIAVGSSILLDARDNFTIIFRGSIIEYAENFVMASKINTSLNTGWMLHCNYGVPKFSIGDGSEIVTANHSVTLDENRIYQFSASYNHTEKKLIFGIDNIFDEFVFPDIDNPEGNTENLLISLNESGSEFYKLGIHSLVFLSASLTDDELKILFDNYRFNDKLLLTYISDINLCLLPDTFGKFYWFDSSGNGRNAKIFGSLLPNYRCKKLIIPLTGLDDDITLSDVIPYSYSIEYISVYNHSSSDCEVSVYSDSDLIVDNETIISETEQNFSIQKLPKLYEDSSLGIYLTGTYIELDILIILKNQLGELI